MVIWNAVVSTPYSRLDFFTPPPQCSVDVTDTASVENTTCNFTNLVSPSEATVSMGIKIKGYDCVSNYNSTTFGNTAVTANTAQGKGVTSFDVFTNVDLSSGYSGEFEFFCAHRFERHCW